MRHLTATLVLGLLLVVFPAPVLSQTPRSSPPPTPSTGGEERTIYDWAASSFYLSAGYRTDDLDWNIAGTRQGSDPNVLSELNWSDVTIYMLKLTNRTVIRDRIYLRGKLDYGVVVSGDNRDSDYGADNRTQEFSRSVNSVDGNSVWDGSVGIGPHLSFLGSRVRLCPLLGYAVARQDFNIVDGYQALADPPATTATGPIDGLDSRYQTRWDGPWIGLDLLLAMPFEKGFIRCVELLFSGEYHWVDYSADADWNLRSDLQHPVSFAHEAEGRGLMVGAMMQFETRSRWGFNFGMSMMALTTDPGLDRVYAADGSIADTRLNEVNWRRFTLETGLSYRF